MTAPTETAPDADATAMPGADYPNANHQEGEQIMTSISDKPAERIEPRYVALSADVYDHETGRVARFLHAEAANLGADWLNNPDATPEDYEWIDPNTNHAVERIESAPLDFNHQVDGDSEVYSTPSKIQPDELYFISRAGRGPWLISLVQPSNDITITEALTYADEVDNVLAFAQQIPPRHPAITASDVVDFADRLGIDAPDLFSAIARLQVEARDAADTSSADDSPTLSDVVAAARKLGYAPSLAALEIAHDQTEADK